MNNDEKAEKEKSRFFNGMNTANRVPIFAVSSSNALWLLLAFVVLIASYCALIVAPTSLVSDSTKYTIDYGVGSVSRFILVAFVTILIVDLFAMKRQAKNRETKAFKQTISELQQKVLELEQKLQK